MSAKEKMDACIQDIRQWMAVNFLNLNDDKTEVIVCHSQNHAPPPFNSVNNGLENITASKAARNIGIIFDSAMTSQPHINAMTSSMYHKIRQIGMIRKYLDKKSAETLEHTFVI